MATAGATAEVALGVTGWCYIPATSGYKWCFENDGEVQVVVALSLEMTTELRQQIDGIDVYSSRGGLVHYPTKPFGASYRGVFRLEDLDQTLRIDYGRYLPPPRPLARAPLQVIFSQEVTLPAAVTYFGSNDCAICLETMANPEFVTFCRHAFHRTCVANYVTANHLWSERGARCRQVCDRHQRVAQTFPCPTCRTPISSNI